MANYKKPPMVLRSDAKIIADAVWDATCVALRWKDRALKAEAKLQRLTAKTKESKT